MEIKELNIKNYKSIKDISIKSPNPFTVFVGPNAAGKSNIFDALEFFSFCNSMDPWEVMRLFGRIQDILHKKCSEVENISFLVDFGTIRPINMSIEPNFKSPLGVSSVSFYGVGKRSESNYLKDPNNTNPFNDPNHKQYFNFCRLFPGNSKLKKNNVIDDLKLSIDGSNLEKVLQRILKNDTVSEEIIELLSLLIPEFRNLEIKSDELSNTDSLVVYEKYTDSPFPKFLLSDGTFNIIVLLCALYQSDEPQFLCIEEPENGLNPKVVREFVSVFRKICEEKGHFIWLNTHSQTLVSELTPKEIVLVDKVNGETKVKQIQDMDLKGLRMDEALLTNAIGGGIPW